MVNNTVSDIGTIIQKGTLDTVVQSINGVLTRFIPGKEEWAVVGFALYLGWLWRNRDYASGGYDVWLKASLILYLLLKILGLGSKLF